MNTVFTRQHSAKARPAPSLARTPAPMAPAISSQSFLIPTISRCACGGGCPRCGTAASSTIKKSSSHFSRDADGVAANTMGMAQPTTIRSAQTSVQRKRVCGGIPGPTGECQECHKKGLQSKSRNSQLGTWGESSIPFIVHEVLRSPGQTLDMETRAFMEPRFGHDFSHVRVHADKKATESAQAVNASAYTVGRDVVFGAGKYEPGTIAGNRLLAHELVHVVQQNQRDKPAAKAATREDAEEDQAKRAVAALSWGSSHLDYGVVARDIIQHSAARPPPFMPKMSPASVHIQRVQLTYDDGPDSAGNTRTVLTALNAAGARATFYLVGKRVAQGDNWRIVFDIAAAGHWLGNHAYDWNDATDNHIFLSGTGEQRAQKILQTEWAIRDALIQGRDDAKKNKTWDTIPMANRDYIEDVIAHGTGRFRTPGFQSHWYSSGGSDTKHAIVLVNEVLAAAGLRPLATTETGTFSSEGVDVDPKDWKTGRTQQEIESAVKSELSSNAESILLHSRIAATAAATPAILADIKSRKFGFDPTAQGQIGSIQPKSGFANLTFSDPPTSAEMAAARLFLKKKMLDIGPVISGYLVIGIFQLAQRAGSAEVNSFVAEIKSTTIQTKDGPIPMANWLNANEQWRLFSSFFENWITNRPFPRIKGVTI